MVPSDNFLPIGLSFVSVFSNQSGSQPAICLIYTTRNQTNCCANLGSIGVRFPIAQPDNSTGDNPNEANSRNHAAHLLRLYSLTSHACFHTGLLDAKPQDTNRGNFSSSRGSASSNVQNCCGGGTNNFILFTLFGCFSGWVSHHFLNRFLWLAFRCSGVSI